MGVIDPLSIGAIVMAMSSKAKANDIDDKRILKAREEAKDTTTKTSDSKKDSKTIKKVSEKKETTKSSDTITDNTETKFVKTETEESIESKVLKDYNKLTGMDKEKLSIAKINRQKNRIKTIEEAIIKTKKLKEEHKDNPFMVKRYDNVLKRLNKRLEVEKQTLVEQEKKLKEKLPNVDENKVRETLKEKYLTPLKKEKEPLVNTVKTEQLTLDNLTKKQKEFKKGSKEYKTYQNSIDKVSKSLEKDKTLLAKKDKEFKDLTKTINTTIKNKGVLKAKSLTDSELKKKFEAEKESKKKALNDKLYKKSLEYNDIFKELEMTIKAKEEFIKNPKGTKAEQKVFLNKKLTDKKTEMLAISKDIEKVDKETFKKFKSTHDSSGKIKPKKTKGFIAKIMEGLGKSLINILKDVLGIKSDDKGSKTKDTSDVTKLTANVSNLNDVNNKVSTSSYKFKT